MSTAKWRYNNNNNLFYSNIGTSDGDLVQGVVTLIGTGVVT